MELYKCWDSVPTNRPEIRGAPNLHTRTKQIHFCRLESIQFNKTIESSMSESRAQPVSNLSSNGLSSKGLDNSEVISISCT